MTAPTDALRPAKGEHHLTVTDQHGKRIRGKVVKAYFLE
jgi:hypothetical protein